MKVKVNDAERETLNWMVAKCVGTEHLFAGHEVGRLHYSTDWAQGGPIIEREHITLRCYTDALWDASIGRLDYVSDGPTPLIAAMRCYVTSELGHEVEVPDELIKGESK